MKHVSDLQLQRYFAGDMPVAAGARLRAHIRRCDRCRMSFERWAEAEAALGGDAAPPGLLDRAQASALSEKDSHRPRQTVALGAAAALAAGVVASVFVLEPSEFRPRGVGPSDGAFQESKSMIRSALVAVPAGDTFEVHDARDNPESPRGSHLRIILEDAHRIRAVRLHPAKGPVRLLAPPATSIPTEPSAGSAKTEVEPPTIDLQLPSDLPLGPAELRLETSVGRATLPLRITGP
ncbi:MAG: hypothetical protein ACFB9M_21125 [Myxococcota bacterium]